MTARQLRRLQLALDDAYVEEIMAMDGEQLRAECIQEGLDPDQIVRDMQAAFDRAFERVRAPLDNSVTAPVSIDVSAS
jgi:hypothetical protein